MDIVLGLGIILVVGYFFGLIAERFNLPRVTAYLISGIIFSENLLGHVINIDFNSWSELLVDICLGLIAFIIGGKLNFADIRTNGKVVFFGTLFESLFPMVFVFSGFYFLADFFGAPTKVAIILSAVAATTAPATTVAIIQQYKAKGRFTDILLEIVALDDAFGIIFFTIVTSVYFGNSLSSDLFTLGTELVLALSIGVILGLCLAKFALLSKSNDYLFPLLLGLVLIVEGVSAQFHFSPLLGCIVFGAVSHNNFKESKEISIILPFQHIEEFIFITFFTMAGTHFSMDHFKAALPLILGYVFFRSLGKYIGANIGIRVGGVTDVHIPKYLGFALLPQAGIAIGLIFEATHQSGMTDVKALLLNVVLGSTIIYELIGPFCSKFALRKAGDLNGS